MSFERPFVTKSTLAHHVIRAIRDCRPDTERRLREMADVPAGAYWSPAVDVVTRDLRSGALSPLARPSSEWLGSSETNQA